MSKAPAMPMYWDAYLGDTTHLTTEEHGAYLLLLAAMWRRDGSVPDDDKDNARIIGLTPAKWRKIKVRLVNTIPGFYVSDGVVSQTNLQKIWKNTQEKIAKNRENGAKGGRPASNENKGLAKANGYVSDNPKQSIPEPESDISTGVDITTGAKSRAVSKRGSRITDDWQPSESAISFGVEKGFKKDEICGRIREEFIDYWIAESGQRASKVDWNRTFQNRLRDLHKYGRVGEGDNGPKRSGGNHRKPNSVIAAANRSLSANGPEHGGSGNPVANVWGAKPRGPGGSPSGHAGRNGGASDAPRIADGTVGPSGGDGIAGHDRGRHDVCERVDGAGVGGVSGRRGAIGNSVDGKTIDILPGTVGTCGSVQPEDGQAGGDSHVPEPGFAKDGSGGGE